MEYVISLFEASSKLSPIAIIGLLVGLLYVVLTKHNQGQAQVEDLRANDLHELREMAETLRRIEVSQAENFATVVSVLNALLNAMTRERK